MALPQDYAERVYAGVLGKMISVYLGRPIEGWSHERIRAELGEIWYYVNDRRHIPLKNHALVVSDDDISGTFGFLRALSDRDNRRDITAREIGQTWLNYIIKERTILWWGGMGNSTEHTAYLRLKEGIAAPRSGSMALNGKVVAEQIGAQIFVDGWAMVAPGDPALAADLPRRASSVSHDGAAIHAAQVLAAMEAQAFVEHDLQRLLDVGISFIPPDSAIARMIGEIRAWHAEEPDWYRTRMRIAERYGYATYGGNVHVMPNHAIIILALLYGDSDFQRSLMIANTAGWDTDCNSGNVGCLLGIKDGLVGIDTGPDWRGPVADRLYVVTAEGGRTITDTVAEACGIVASGRALAGEDPTVVKRGARFHFDLPGAVQGFRVDERTELWRTATVENVPGNSALGRRSLAIRYRLTTGLDAHVATPTFIPPDALDNYYTLLASPTLYPGQTVGAGITADGVCMGAATYRLYLTTYDAHDEPIRVYGPEIATDPGERTDLSWTIPDTGNQPIGEIGIALRAPGRAEATLYLDTLTWDGAPDCTLTRPAAGGSRWRRAWTQGVDHFLDHPDDIFRLVQDQGRGLLIQGTRDWADYEIRTTVTPHMVTAAGIAVRVQGMERYYALLLQTTDRAQLVRALDGTTILGEIDFPWEFGRSYAMRLRAAGDHLQAWIDGRCIFDLHDGSASLRVGGSALVCEEGRMAADEISVRAIR